MQSSCLSLRGGRLPDPLDKVGGDARIKHGISLIGHDVDIALPAHVAKRSGKLPLVRVRGRGWDSPLFRCTALDCRVGLSPSSQ